MYFCEFLRIAVERDVVKMRRKSATKTPSWASLTLSFWTASKYSWKISEFLMAGVNQDSFPKIISGFAESIIVQSSTVLSFID